MPLEGLPFLSTIQSKGSYSICLKHFLSLKASYCISEILVFIISDFHEALSGQETERKPTLPTGPLGTDPDLYIKDGLCLLFIKELHTL